MLNQGKLSSFVTYNPVSLSSTTTLAEAIQTLAETGIHQWPVIDDDLRLVGILSERDILRALAQRVPELVGAVSSGVANAASSPAANLTVVESMSNVVELVTLNETPRQVLKKLIEDELGMLPVIKDEMVVGVTTVTDFLREFSYGQIALSKSQVSVAMDPIEVIGGETTLNDAWSAFIEHDAECLGVVRGDFPLGVLSKCDLQLAMCRVAISNWLAVTAVERDFECRGPQTVLEIISMAPTIRPGERLQGAATLMLDHSCKAIAVVNQANRLMGGVTELGILRRMLNYLV